MPASIVDYALDSCFVFSIVIGLVCKKTRTAFVLGFIVSSLFFGAFLYYGDTRFELGGLNGVLAFSLFAMCTCQVKRKLLSHKKIERLLSRKRHADHL
jgi:hypothetical protein